MMNTEEISALLDWYESAKRDLPWRKTQDSYRIWVSEIMLQQTRVEAVKPYYAAFLDKYPDVSALADAREDDLIRIWEGLGYYSRVRNMHKAAMDVKENHGGLFPVSAKQSPEILGPAVVHRSRFHPFFSRALRDRPVFDPPPLQGFGRRAEQKKSADPVLDLRYDVCGAGDLLCGQVYYQETDKKTIESKKLFENR